MIFADTTNHKRTVNVVSAFIRVSQLLVLYPRKSERLICSYP